MKITKQMAREKWLPLKYHEGLYEISDLGNIRSVIKPLKTGKNMCTTTQKNGYITIRLKGIDGKRKNNRVHRLVLMTFTEDSDKYTNHKNGIRG